MKLQLFDTMAEQQMSSVRPFRQLDRSSAPDVVLVHLGGSTMPIVFRRRAIDYSTDTALYNLATVIDIE